MWINCPKQYTFHQLQLKWLPCLQILRYDIWQLRSEFLTRFSPMWIPKGIGILANGSISPTWLDQVHTASDYSFHFPPPIILMIVVQSVRLQCLNIVQCECALNALKSRSWTLTKSHLLFKPSSTFNSRYRPRMWEMKVEDKIGCLKVTSLECQVSILLGLWLGKKCFELFSL